MPDQPPDLPAPPLTLDRWFEQVARRFPDRVAVTCGQVSWSYAELNQHAGRLACWLRAQGVNQETPVAICLERSLDLVAGILAILKAGGTYVPIDPDCPAERLAFLLVDVQAPVLITQSSLAEKVPAHPARVLCLDRPGAWQNDSPLPDASAAVADDRTAYVIYTSGSTGRPKGCCVTHRNVTRLFTATAPWFGFNEHDVWTLFHSCAFDFSVWEMWGALLHGGKLVVVPHLVSRSPADFHQLLARKGVTVLNQTPSAFRQFLVAEEAASPRPALALRHIIFGGEALEMRSLLPWFARHGDQRPRLVNMYGITETTVHVTYRPLTAQDVERGSVIGVPIPDLQVHVLDPRMHECPPGKPGEIFVGGAGVARGYLNRPELTEERFVPSPFIPGERLYRSGDLAVRLPDGDLQYLGRIDQQVKLRGFRIELGEIESALLTHPAVREAAVLARDGTDGKELLAFVVPTRDRPAAGLREHLARTLPDYMVPAAFVAVEHMPLTANGKLDRPALLASAGRPLDRETDFEPPQGPLETGLAEIWQAVLGRECVGRADDFFVLGGHSLQAMQVAARVSRLRGATVPVPLLFQQPVLADFARAVGQLEPVGETPASLPPGADVIALSPMQRGMLLDSLREPNSGVNVEQFSWRMPDTVDRSAFLGAWRWLARRHEPLRTAFHWENLETPVQEVYPETQLAVQQADWRSASPEDCQRGWRDFVATDRQRGFDLRTAPLWRLALIHGPNAETWFLWTIHHAIIDGRSLAILLREMTLAYDALRQGGIPTLPAPQRYRDFVNWIGQHDLGSAESYWRSRLAGIGPLPQFKTRPPLDSPAPDHFRERCEVRLPATLAASLRHRAKALGVTSNTLFQGAWALLLGRWCGACEVVFGGTRAGRRSGPWKGSDGVGIFINTLPLRAVLDPGDRLETLLRSLRRQQVEVRDYEHTPLSLIQQWCAQGRPLFETFLMFERFEWGSEIEKLCAPLAATDVQLHEAPGYPLSLSAYDGPQPLLRFHYDARRFTGASIAQMQDDYRLLLEAMVADPDATIGDLLQRLPEPDGAGEASAGPPAGGLPSLADCSTGKGIALEWNAPQLQPPEDRSVSTGTGRQPQPLSAEQQRLWFLDRTLPCPAAYNVPLVFRLRGPLNLALLEKSLQIVVGRHEILRTRFLESEGQPAQVTVPGVGPQLELQDLRGVPATQREAHAQAGIAQQLARPFDLSAAPPWRMTCLQLGDEEHVLALVAHHIICDEWSLRLWVGELEALYAAGGDAGHAQLSELTMQYGDYAVRQRVRLAQPAMELHRAYWSKQLEGFAGGLELPFDHARPARPTLRGGMVRAPVPGGVVRRLQELGLAEGTTWFMVLLAAWQTLLARLSGQADIVVAVPLAQREQPEVEVLIGFFLNTVPLRTKVEMSRSFRELLRQVRQTALDSFQHGTLPFDEIVRLGQTPRSADFTTLAQVMLVLNQDLPRGLCLPEIKGEAVDLDWGLAKFDLTLTVSESAQGDWLAALQYSEDLFEPATIGRMSEQLVRLLKSLAAAPDAPLGTLDLLPETQRRRLVEEFSRAETAFTASANLHELFEDQVRQTPEAVAVVDESGALTFRELDARANQLARHLQGLGAGSGVLVGIGLERSREMVVAMVATLKTGGAYVPLDPGYPRERLEFMIEDSGLKVILTLERLIERWPDTPVPRVLVDASWPEISRHSPAPLPGVVSQEDTAYVIYTSGSTGRPNGVVVSHRAVAGHILAASHCYGITRTDRVLGFASPSFDAAVEQMWTALSSGAVFVLRGNDWMTVRELTRFISRQALTVINVPPAMWVALAEEWLQLGVAAEVRSLRLVIVGGDVMLASGLALWRRTSLQNVRLLNAYGPTETTITALVYDAGAQAANPTANSRIPTGRPLGNRRCHILNEALQLAPIGVAGELFIGGENLAQGYLNRPELTAERFIPDPFSANPQARVYRTGDRCRWLPDGNVEFLGRLDDQVKIRGFRVELGEIEAELSKHPEVRHSALLARKLPDGSRELVAYVTLGGNGQVPMEDLRQFLRRRLPEHMIPADFLLVEQMPLTPNGKIDRRALQAVAGKRLRVQRVHQPPRSALEVELSALWESLLRRTPEGIDDNFFDLGGHSLLAMQAAARLTKSLGIDVSVRWLFDHPTIRALGVAITAAQGERVTARITPVSRDGPLRVSHEQERLWFLHAVLADPAAYNVVLALRLKGPLDLARLARAWQGVVDRHELLRMRFVEDAGAVWQLPVDGYRASVETEDLTGLAEQARSLRVEAAVREEAGQVFELKAAPPHRLKFLRLDDTDHVLLLTLHHILSDEWSARLLCAELGSNSAGEAAPAPLPVQYADYSAWQRQRVAEGQLNAQRDYWRQQLAGAPTQIDLPTDRSRPARSSSRGGQVRFRVSRELAARLDRLRSAEGATTFMVWLTLFEVLLHRLSGQEDFLVGTPLAQRQVPEVQSLIGFFLNTLPLRVRAEPMADFRAWLRQTRAAVLAAFEHGELPFNEIARLLDRTAAQSAPLQVLFVMQSAAAGERLRLPGVSVEPMAVDNGTAKFDLTLFLDELPEGGCEGMFEFSADLFDKETVERTAAQFLELVEAQTAAPDAPVAEAPLLPEDQRRTVVEDFNHTRIDFLRAGGLHGLFQAQVRSRPEAAAVIFGDAPLSYGELDQHAGQLASELLRLGVGPGALVGLCLERSPLMIVAILGVLKAGGASLPLDPAYPAERLRFMLADAQPTVLISQTSLLDRLAESRCPKLALDVWRPPGVARERPASSFQPDNLAYVLFTSGSTGRPKGVAMSQGALLNLISWQSGQSGCGVGDCTLQFASLSFDVSFQEVFATLCTGGTLVLVPETVRRDLLALTRLIREQRVARLFLPFVVLDELARCLNGSGPQPLALREVITAGEQLRITPAIAELFTRHSGATLVNQYGPTETHVVTVFALAGPPAAWPTLPPIGRPIANTRVYVLDAGLRPVPVGVVGELCVGGCQVARGYLNRPELTAQKFVPDPFSAEAGARLYRTGDRCRWLKEGVLEFLGRRDEQVKVRGFRVELGEIEAVLARHPAVQQAVVIGRATEGGITGLAAFVVGRPGAELAAKVLREHLQGQLPEHMVPSAFAVVARLPLTPNGKVDRRALVREAASEARPVRPVSVGPRDEIEARLVTIWESVLGRRPVGVQDDFFELGGHSLLAMGLMREIEQCLGRSLPLASLFSAPTIEQFARLFSAAPVDLAGRLRGIGNGTPLFHIPGIAGYEFLPEAVVQRLSSVARFFDGLQYPGLDGRESPATCVEAIAAHLIPQITRVFPEGPYRLGGYSFGGVVAYEMARQMQARGLAVETVLLWDSFTPDSFRKRSTVETYQALREHLRRLRGWERLAFLPRVMRRKLVHWSCRLIARLKPRPPSAPEETATATGPVADPRAQVLAASLAAYSVYQPGPYAGNVILFQVEDRQFGLGVRYAPDLTNGWGPLVGDELQMLHVPGNHQTLLQEPAVSALAEAIVGCLLKMSSKIA